MLKETVEKVLDLASEVSAFQEKPGRRDLQAGVVVCRAFRAKVPVSLHEAVVVIKLVEVRRAKGAPRVCFCHQPGDRLDGQAGLGAPLVSHVGNVVVAYRRNQRENLAKKKDLVAQGGRPGRSLRIVEVLVPQARGPQQATVGSSFHSAFDHVASHSAPPWQRPAPEG